MIHILAQVDIAELPRFLGVFATQGAQQRRRHGSRHVEVFTVPAEPDRVVLLFQWESRQSFQGFLDDESTRASMQASGTMGKPNFTFLESIATLPG